MNWGNLGEAYYLNGERPEAAAAFREAVSHAKRDLAVNPRDPQALKYLANYSAMLADRISALKYVSKALEVSKFDKDSLFAAAAVYNDLGETGLALEWLGKALRAGYSPKTVMQQPDLDNLHGDQRFQDLFKSNSSGPSQRQ